MASIVFRNVDKFFGPRQVLHGLSFRVEPGEIVGLLGPNGSGKTTTLRLIAGYYQADSGTVEFLGLPRDAVAAGGNDHKSHAEPGRGNAPFLHTATGARAEYVGYLPERAPLYDSLTVLQYLRFVGSCKGLKGRALSASVDDSMAAFDLGSVAKTAIGRLSKGFRQRVGLGQAVLGNPAVLLLDEATNGLDPLQIIEAREMIRRAAEGRAVVFSSHLMQEVQALCTRAIILRHGRLITDIALNEPGATGAAGKTGTSGASGALTVVLHWHGNGLGALVASINALGDVVEAVAVPSSALGKAHVVKIRYAARPASLNPLLACAMSHGEVEQIFFDDQSVESLLVHAIRQADEQAASIGAAS